MKLNIEIIQCIYDKSREISELAVILNISILIQIIFILNCTQLTLKTERKNIKRILTHAQPFLKYNKHSHFVQSRLNLYF